jgi:RNA polymerase sigma factor (sigma-70 family)
MRVPPFERFYDAHRGEVHAFLVRRLGRDRADDAFQDTFLRALRAYDRVDGRNLRAWVLTIAQRVSFDELRKRRLYDVPPGWTEHEEDERPAYAELEHLTSELPPKERAAVVLRYGYDFGYDEIAAALGSTPDAARQAASSGVRRLRRKEDR